jgi:H+-translocating NAD(P) transhydrogenase subunit alpha
MKVGVARESAPGERRVALVPEALGKLTAAGLEILVEHDAGSGAAIPDSAYSDAGATIVSTADLYGQSDIVLRVQKPSDSEVKVLRQGQAVLGLLQPLIDPQTAAALAKQGVTAISLDAIPRTLSRAQTMDALSSQANIAGYRAVLVASTHLPRYFPLLMTAAGTVPPAKVLVLGAGVAGLQAIATARRLGAVVSAFDVRPAVREQVESLGATFLEVELPEAGETSGGYAQELSEATQRLQRELLAEHIAGSDVVVTTALVPGRPAPKLIAADMVASMRPGSVIVDLAAEAGGNCELTEPGATVVRENVTIVGDRNPATGMPYDASRLYARNVTELLGVCLNGGRIEIAADDDVIAGCLVCHGGAVVHPAVLERLQ